MLRGKKSFGLSLVALFSFFYLSLAKFESKAFADAVDVSGSTSPFINSRMFTISQATRPTTAKGR